MKKKNTISLILLMAISAIFLGCQCPPPPNRLPPPDPIPESYRPLTPAILRRLEIQGIDNFEVKLLGRIVLEREIPQTSPPVRGEDGILRYQESFTREVISFNDGITGEVKRDETPRTARMLRTGNDVVLHVFFEDENTPEEDYYLRFSANMNRDDDFFSLLYDQKGMSQGFPPPQIARGSSLDDDYYDNILSLRGKIEYGMGMTQNDKEYDLRYSGNRAPYLMIRLEQQDETIIGARVDPGRWVRIRL